MAEDRVAGLKRTCGWLPPGRQACVEQLIRGWLVVPDRDRGDRAESRCVEDQERAVGNSEEHIVRVLVLDHHISRVERWILCDGPAERVLQGRERGRGFGQRHGQRHEDEDTPLAKTFSDGAGAV